MLTKTSKISLPNIQIDKSRISDKRYLTKKIYKLLTDPNRTMNSYSVICRTSLVRSLEKTLRTEFKNTRDFRRKIEKYLEGYDFRLIPVNERVKKARKKLGWNQKELAAHLGYSSHVSILLFENGKRFPSKRIFQWLDEMKM